MNGYHVQVAVEASSPMEHFESLFDAVADAFADCADIMNADVSADLRTRTLTFEMDVETETEVDALESALVAVRTALHASGGATAAWEDHFRMLRQTIEVPALDQPGMLQA
ncbi:hypothetical protein [Leifsonia shinshuensis]|uniref:hypothetical protein n=1 Tax=Leifsonia shinshuensis TaxID=150026 RepID=UPI0028612607|nr:hypothetical protein [Leifsonia shinshuensis]MDR6970833.1 hypothetical protein [Leifsonia shinshuensis]